MTKRLFLLAIFLLLTLWVRSAQARYQGMITAGTLTLNLTQPQNHVIFHANDGYTPEATASQDFVYGVAQNLRANDFTNKTATVAATFVGWNTLPGGTGTSYTDTQEVINLSRHDGGIVDLYAQWRAGSGLLGLNKLASVAAVKTMSTRLRTSMSTGAKPLQVLSQVSEVAAIISESLALSGEASSSAQVATSSATLVDEPVLQASASGQIAGEPAASVSAQLR